MTTEPVELAPISEERPRTVIAFIVAAILFALVVVIWSAAKTPTIETTDAHEPAAIDHQRAIEVTPNPTTPAPAP